MNSRRNSLALALFIALVVPACVTEYGRTRLVWQRPVRVQLPATCGPVVPGAPTLVVNASAWERPLPGVLIKISSLTARGEALNGVVGAKGRYEALLAPGAWEVECRLSGFAPLRVPVTIEAGSACSISVVLELSEGHVVT